MKINESKIRQIIREEAHRVLREGAFPEENGEAPPEMGGSPREELESYLMDNGDSELVDAVMSAIDAALDRSMNSGEAPTSEDVTFNLSDEMLDMIPERDEDDWHEMLDAVLKDEFDPGAFEEAEADRESEEETHRDLGHPSRFLPSRGSRY